MSREELVANRETIAALVETLRRQGDYDANAPSIRKLAEAMLAVLDDMLLKHRL